MTSRGRLAAYCASLVLAATTLSALIAGSRGAAIAMLAALIIEALVFLTACFPVPRAVRQQPTRRPALPTPAGAGTQRQLAAIRLATRGPRWADIELRPQLRRIVDGLSVSRPPTRREDAVDELLAWFIDPNRRVRDHDEGSALSLHDIEVMIGRIEERA